MPIYSSMRYQCLRDEEKRNGRKKKDESMFIVDLIQFKDLGIIGRNIGSSFWRARLAQTTCSILRATASRR